jgi:hypothetical protein
LGEDYRRSRVLDHVSDDLATVGALERQTSDLEFGSSEE